MRYEQSAVSLRDYIQCAAMSATNHWLAIRHDLEKHHSKPFAAACKSKYVAMNVIRVKLLLRDLMKKKTKTTDSESDVMLHHNRRSRSSPDQPEIIIRSFRKNKWPCRYQSGGAFIAFRRIPSTDSKNDSPICWIRSWTGRLRYP